MDTKSRFTNLHLKKLFLLARQHWLFSAANFCTISKLMFKLGREKSFLKELQSVPKFFSGFIHFLEQNSVLLLKRTATDKILHRGSLSYYC